jgi:hypothetical protein
MFSDTVFRNIGINSVLALLFTTYPLAPAAIASLAKWGRVGLAHHENQSRGNSCLMRRAASKPFITGIAMSSSTTSGLRTHLTDSVSSVRSFADDLNISLRLENLADAPPNDLAVVHHEHAKNERLHAAS